VRDAAVLAAHRRDEGGDLRIARHADERDAPLPPVLEHIGQTLRDVIRVVGEIAHVGPRASKEKVNPDLVHHASRSRPIEGRFAVAQR